MGSKWLKLSLKFYFDYILIAGQIRKMFRLIKKHNYLTNDISLKVTLENSIFSSITAQKKKKKRIKIKLKILKASLCKVKYKLSRVFLGDKKGSAAHFSYLANTGAKKKKRGNGAKL